jgi:acetyl-CoA carboxylase biotin carboxyl carrier protein
MEARQIKALLVLMQDYGLSELEIEDKKGRVRLVRGALDDALTHHSAVLPNKAAKSRAVTPTAGAAGESTSVGASEPKAAAPADQIELAPNQKLVVSPMVGTFYRAAAPNSPPFVEEGDTVRKGQPLCIIEAMKMMNEIEADTAGRVVRILCENGSPVEYGQPLIILESA